MSQRLELKDTKKHKTHNIQPQHENGGTRVSGSFSNLSVGSGTYSGTSRRRSTVAAGWYEHVSIPRTTTGGYSHLVSSGHLPRFSFSWFCVPMYNVVFMACCVASPLVTWSPAQLNSRSTCRVVAFNPETSRDHLLITCSTGQLYWRQYSAHAAVYCTS